MSIPHWQQQAITRSVWDLVEQMTKDAQMVEYDTLLGALATRLGSRFQAVLHMRRLLRTGILRQEGSQVYRDLLGGAP